MMRNRLLAGAVGLLALASIASPSRADLVASFSKGITTPNSATIRVGFSFTTAGTTSDEYSDLSLTIFEDTASTTPEALGNGFLESAAYLGTPAALSSSAYIATTAASAGSYTFAPSVTLQGGTKYWFYEDAALTGSTLGFGVGNNAGEAVQDTFSSLSSFSSPLSGDGFNFTLTGTAPSTAPAAAPEPRSVLLGGMMFGLFGGFTLIRRRRIAKALDNAATL